MKLVNYNCTNCDYSEEKLFSREEKIPNTLDNKCPICNGQLKKFNFKNNSQRVFVNDPQK